MFQAEDKPYESVTLRIQYQITNEASSECPLENIETRLASHEDERVSDIVTVFRDQS